MKTKATEVDRAHGLPRIHKKYTDLPSFRAIIDTKNTPHYGIGKLLTRLLNSLTQNVFSIKDSFESVDRIVSVITNITDEWKDKFRRTRDQCRRVKKNQRQMRDK